VLRWKYGCFTGGTGGFASREVPASPRRISIQWQDKDYTYSGFFREPWPKSAVIADREVLDSGVEFGVDSQDVAGAVLTFSDRRSEDRT